MAYGVILQAEYEDGFVLKEKRKNDESPYAPGRNTYNAIVSHHPEPEHGPLIRFTAVHGRGLRKKTYTIDWTELGADAEPVYYRNMKRSIRMDGTHDTGPICIGHFFGYRDGEVEEIQELGEAS